MIEQLALWQEEPVDDCPAGFERVPPMGGTMEMTWSWGPGGDSSPQELARIARVSLGSWETRRATNGELIWFRVIATRIEGTGVVGTLRRIEPIVKPGRAADGKYDDDEEGPL